MRYLDLAATTPVRREAIEAMWPYLTSEFGNPSSTHAFGFGPAEALKAARSRVAALLGARASRVVFTSGGTEADNLAVKGIALASPRDRRVVVSAVEHPAVLESARYLERVHGLEVAVAPVDEAGRVRLDELDRLVTPGTALVSVMGANNEVGTLQPVAQIAALAAQRGVPVHTDAVQLAASEPVSVSGLGVAALSISGHKLGAPKGVGALALDPRVRVEPVIHGGGQEGELRSGTENVAGAVALAVALEATRAETTAGEVAAWRARTARFMRRVLDAVPEAIVTGPEDADDRLPGHASFCFPATSGESVLLGLGEAGVVCSSGSACAAGKDEPSPVLLAMGFAPEVAQTAVRFSFGREAAEAELDAVADALAETVAGLRRRFVGRP